MILWTKYQESVHTSKSSIIPQKMQAALLIGCSQSCDQVIDSDLNTILISFIEPSSVMEFIE